MLFDSFNKSIFCCNKILALRSVSSYSMKRIKYLLLVNCSAAEVDNHLFALRMEWDQIFQIQEKALLEDKVRIFLVFAMIYATYRAIRL